MTQAVKTQEHNTVSIADLVDRYAELHAQINDLEAAQSLVKAQLLATGETNMRGTFVRAVVSTSAPRRTTDWKGVAAELKAPQDLIDTYTKVGEPTTSVRLYAN